MSSEREALQLSGVLWVLVDVVREEKRWQQRSHVWLSAEQLRGTDSLGLPGTRGRLLKISSLCLLVGGA